jgi:tetratricopeptide (TPR) repeat protein
MMGRDIAESLKENGNAFYQASFFAKAENVYYKALNEMEDPKLPVVLRVTIYSNRANARFEMGNYSGAADDSSNAIGVVHSEGKALDDDKNQALLSKNEWRLARCLFYDQRDDELKALVAAKEAESDSIFLEKVKFFTNSMKFKDKLNKSSGEFSPQILRSSLTFPFCEHYPFGHDNAESLLDEVEIVPNCQFNVLFGGVGDARHVFTTILDHHYHRLKKSIDFHLHITMNDINTAVLVKDILVLVLSYRIGNLLADFDPRSGSVIDALEKIAKHS